MWVSQVLTTVANCKIAVATVMENITGHICAICHTGMGNCMAKDELV